MATKFYLPSSGSAPASPDYDTDWENSTIAARLPCYITKQSTTMTTVSLTGDTNKVNQDILYRQYISPKLSAQTISAQIVRFVARCSQTDVDNNLFNEINIRSWNGSTFQDIVSMRRNAVEAALTLTNLSNTGTSTQVTVAAGDYLVIEIGMGGDPAASGADGHNSSMRIGDASANDCVFNDTGTDDYNPWVEFANNISFLHQLTVNDAYSTTQTDSVSVTKGTSITGVADAYSTTQVDGIVLTGVSTSLVVNDAFSTTQTDHVSTTKETTLGGITDAYCTTQTDNVITTVIHNLTGISDAYCETQADAVVITGPSGIDLTVADAYCLTQADTISYFPQILFPESTIHYGNWTNESGVGDTNLYQSIDEANYSDADYAQSEWNPATSPVAFKLQDGLDPTSASGHILRYRIEKYPDGSKTQAVTVQLRQDYIEEGSQGTLIAEWVDNDLSETITTVERTLTTDQANSITDYTSLFVRIVTEDVMKLSNSDDDRYLVNASGDPVLLIGTSSWALITGLLEAEVDTYLADRISRGFNAILVQLIDHYYADNAPSNAYADAPFSGEDFITPVEDYFAHADYVIGKAQELGIYVLLAPVYLGYGGTEEGWDTEVDAASTADMTYWGEYVGNRYKDYGNIIWVMSGDHNPTGHMTKLNAFMTGLQTYANQLVTIHNSRNSEAFTYEQPVWLNSNNIYTQYLNTSGWAEDAYARSPTIPFFQIEAWYEGVLRGLTAQEVRAQAYWTILGGGLGGHIFGNEELYYFTTGWDDNLNTTGSNNMHILADFFNSVEWHTLIPDPSHTVLTSGYGVIDEATWCGVAMDSGGTLAVIYMPSNRTMTVDMSEFSGTVTCRWFDPTDGSYAADAASPHANSGTHDFSHAGTNADGDADWILILEA